MLSVKNSTGNSQLQATKLDAKEGQCRAHASATKSEATVSFALLSKDQIQRLSKLPQTDLAVLKRLLRLDHQSCPAYVSCKDHKAAEALYAWAKINRSLLNESLFASFQREVRSYRGALVSLDLGAIAPGTGPDDQ